MVQLVSIEMSVLLITEAVSISVQILQMDSSVHASLLIQTTMTQMDIQIRSGPSAKTVMTASMLMSALMEHSVNITVHHPKNVLTHLVSSSVTRPYHSANLEKRSQWQPPLQVSFLQHPHFILLFRQRFIHKDFIYYHVFVGSNLGVIGIAWGSVATVVVIALVVGVVVSKKLRPGATQDVESASN